MDLLTGRKLLLADDSVTIQKVVDLTFSDEGMQVTTVSDGEQAIARLAEIAPDIVLADIHMPKSSGYQVCEEIKRDQRFRHVPVILLVGSFEPFDEEEARRVGADDYLTKPFQSIRQLVNKVGSLLGGDGPARDEDGTETQRLPSMLGLAGQEQEARGGDAEQGDPVAMEVATADTAPLPAPPQTEHQSEHQARDEMGPLSIENAPSEDERGAETVTSDDLSAGWHPDYTAQWSRDAQGSSGWSDAQTENIAPDAAATVDAGTAQVAGDGPEPFSLEQATEPQYAQAGQGVEMSYSARPDDSLLDLGEIEPVYSAHAEDDFILDLQDEAFYRKPPAIDAGGQEPSAAATGSMDEATALSLEDELAGAEHRAQDFAEAQLAGERRREEFASIGAEEASEVSEESGAPQTFVEGRAFGAEALTAGPLAETGGMGQHDAQASSAAAGGSASPGGQIGLDQLSPEVIDAIARRAVEHLSDRVVREIAWEVVPQLAELLIKRRMEEERAPAK